MDMIAVSPIARALATAAETKAKPVSSVSLIAPLSHGAAWLAVSWDFKDGCGLWRQTDVPGVSVMGWSRMPDSMIQLPPMIAPEQAAIAAAWAWGAWDIVRTCLGPGYQGALPEGWQPFAEDLRAQGYVIWTWRPMMGGPEIRAKAHWRSARAGKRDATLHPITLARHEACPDISPPPIRPGTQHVLTLGRNEDAGAAKQAKRVPGATAKQIGLIRALRREAGEDDWHTIPALTIRDASAWIERLTGVTAPRNRGRGHA